MLVSAECCRVLVLLRWKLPLCVIRVVLTGCLEYNKGGTYEQSMQKFGEEIYKCETWMINKMDDTGDVLVLCA